MPAISLVTLAVADMARARAFYEALGLRAAPESNDEVVFLDGGGVVLSLYGRDALAEDTGLPDGRPGGITLAFNVKTPEEVPARLAVAEAAGARILKGPRTMPWGGVTAYFADPDGHPWEITWVDFALTEDGRILLDMGPAPEPPTA
ncbi:VOC family protein [Roseospira navarrensis]|uniref:VOC family protein n=1 Tax=Roseospira navarrensis TaxID=140058 RepID=A0A7X2D2I9_9PROT|nr:VOC family protein [Roseospira navarrensis]MQX35751.1 VOC family protein [Roseospira navarrensis]